MYQFIDTNEYYTLESRPSEALQINGVYPEDVVEGYRTLYVKGREILAPELTSVTVGSRHGSIPKSSRYPERQITIGFQLISRTNEDFREAFNKLNSLIREPDSQLIFDDEPDKYFVGTLSEAAEIDPGSNKIIGEYIFTCADPFKYSVDEFEAEPEMVEENGYSTFLIDYEGTHPAFPKYETLFYTQNVPDEWNGIDLEADTEPDEDDRVEDLTSNGNEDEALGTKGACGYVAFFNEREKILQFGNPENNGQQEVSEITETMINQSFCRQGNFGSEVQESWPVNVAVILPMGGVTGSQSGNYGIKASYKNAVSNSITATLLNAASGTNTKYTVSAVASNRRTDRVNLKVTIKMSKLTKELPKKGKLTAVITVNGTNHSLVIKNSGKAWKKGHTYSGSLSFDATGLSTGTDNLTGIRFRVDRSGGDGSVGRLSSVACRNMPIPTYIAPKADSYYLGPTSYGTAQMEKWHGPAITRTIGSDSGGEAGASDFILSWSMKMAMGNGANDLVQQGAMQVAVITGDLENGVLKNRSVLAAASVYKNKSGKNGSYAFYIGTSIQGKAQSIDLTLNNKCFGENTSNSKAVKSCSIKKEGEKIYFNIGGKTKQVTLPSAKKNQKAYQVVFYIAQYSGFPLIDWMGIYNVKFVKKKVLVESDPIPFSAGDYLIADASNGELTLNGLRRPDLGALGNDWEEMSLLPGLNQISTSYSDWCCDTAYRQCRETDYYDSDTTYYVRSGDSYVAAAVTEEVYEDSFSDYYVLESCAPRFKIRYREVFL